MSIPIVTIHLGDREYLGWILAQAKHSNPESNVFLLGDYSSKHYKFVDHEYIGNYFKEAQEFKNIYKHLSHNSLNYELFCFQRWFVLKNFMETQNLQSCLCIDSDVMLYANLEEEQQKFYKFDFALYKKWNPHCIFINNLKTLSQFCEFLVDIYVNNQKVEILMLEYKNCPPGKIVNICDMVAFHKFCESNLHKIGDLSIISNGSVYDNNINSSEGFEMCNSRKKICFIGNHPFCRHLILDEYIKFNALHLQGYAKLYSIEEYFTGDIIPKEGENWVFQDAKINEKENENSNTTNYNKYLERKNLGEKFTFRPLKLSEINLIIFPNWSELEQSLCRNLEQLIRGIATHPNRSYITLLIDTSGISGEEAELVLSSMLMNLFIQEDLDVTEEPEIALIGNLEEIQWKALLPHLHVRIVLENENQQAIAQARAESIPVCQLDNLVNTQQISEGQTRQAGIHNEQ